MMHTLENELKKYHALNSMAKSNSVVFFGSDSFLKIPFTELSDSFSLDIPVYNRSIKGLSITNCEEVLKECIYELNPSKVFLNIGEEDIKKQDFNCEKFISTYEWLLYTVYTHCKGRIYVVSIAGNNSKTSYVNEKLKTIAVNTGCRFIDITAAKEGNVLNEVKAFDILRCYLRGKNISLTEIFSLA